MSDTYRALTRTYRPRTFEDIVSQEHVTSTLQNAIKQNRLSHAYMFCGPRGVGKTTMARVLARTINQIDDTVDGEALNMTLNITEIDAASNNKVEDVHHLRESLRIPPQNGKYKIYIVDEVHMLSKAAFNALLKSLEEPPEHVIFIFATTEPHKVLPTILSRVQRFDFKRISVADIVERLQLISKEQGITIDNESLHVIAKKADGALRDALGLMDQAIAFCGTDIKHEELLQALNVVGTDLYFELMQFIHAHDSDGGLSFFNRVLQEGYDIQEFLVGMAEHIRNLYIANTTEQMFLIEASNETKQRYAQQAKLFSRDDLMRILHQVSDCQIKIKDAHQPRIVFEVMLIKLMHMGRSEELSTLLSELEGLKKKIESGEITTAASAPVEDEVQTEAKSEEPASQPELSSETVHGIISETTVTQIESTTESTTIVEQEKVGFSLFGSPSLDTGKETTNGNGNGHVIAHAHKHMEQTVEQVEVEEETQLLVANGTATLDDITGNWLDFVARLENEFNHSFLLILQRCKADSLKGLDLLIKVENSLHQEICENKMLDLSKQMKKHFGKRYNLKFMVERVEKTDSGESLSPYDRFLNLQKRDPLIKEIVNTFGATLEY